MSGLFATLRTGLNSLSNLQTAMAVIRDNIANVNTPGYTRKRVIYKPLDPEVHFVGVIGRGTDIERIQSIRERVVERRILSESQIKGSLEGQQFILGQAESILFASEGSGLGDRLSSFFNSFSELAADASSIAKRGVVLAEGRTLGTAIAAVAGQLEQLSADNRLQVRDSIGNITSKLDQIARINSKLTFIERQGLDSGVLRDQRQQLMNELAEEVGFDSFENESGSQTITTSTGRVLLAGNQVIQLEASDSGTGMVVKLDGLDITSELALGRLGGILKLDGTVLPAKLQELDSLAKELADEVNAVHKTGAGLDASTGLDFFSYSSGNPAGSLAVVITDEQKLAAGPVGGGPGDGTIAQQLGDLRDKSIVNLGNQTFVGRFSEMVFEAGLESRQVVAGVEAQNKIVVQLFNQRDSVSGVSLDEEAVNLIQLQTSYEASARLIRIVNELLSETINLLR